MYFLLIVLTLLLFLLGASIFSFLNVIVYRLPKKISFVQGRSFCPACGRTLSPLDLVPVFSWLFLRGKCRSCQTKIGVRSLLTEGFGGILLLFLLHFYQDPWTAGLVYAFFSVLFVVAMIDLDTMEIPDGCSLAIIVLSLFSVFLMPQITLLERGIGFVCISVPMLLLTLLIPGAFGGGDIKLMAVCGLFMGWKLLLVSALLGFVIGGIWGSILLLGKKAGRKDHFAFGPSLCLGMLPGLLWGLKIISWYLGFLQF